MSVSIKSVRVSTLAVAIATGAVGFGPAFAQDASTPPPADAAQASPPAATASDSSDQGIVVTGSRIQSNFDRPTPVTILGAERLKDRGLTNVGDALNELPQFRASSTPATSGLNAGPGQNIGGRVLDLRGLGAVRTLTLVDGKRFVPATTQATVDTNMVPSIMLSRAEVVTGGASAVYGSDAVAGVVNLLIDKKYTGYKFNAELGVTDKNDDFTRQFGAEAGWQVGSNLHLVVGGEWE
jgi:outer membrane receptor for ferrienterochelin and colicin